LNVSVERAGAAGRAGRIAELGPVCVRRHRDLIIGDFDPELGRNSSRCSMIVDGDRVAAAGAPAAGLCSLKATEEPLMRYPFGKWVSIDLQQGAPVVAFVYLDAQAGPSARGGSITVRLSPAFQLTELSAAEIEARHLPARPEWLHYYGPQPDPDAPWHRDPLLSGQLHEQFPDDLQAIVHDGEPRRTQRAPELCWVRMVGVEPAPHRPGVDDQLQSPHVYLGVLLNAPHGLISVQRGDQLKLLAARGLPHPLHVTNQYLTERPSWTITPCDRCGASECYDPPSVLARTRFPDLPADTVVERFTSLCARCGGTQELARTG
jgi:hypothetical protein